MQQKDNWDGLTLDEKGTVYCKKAKIDFTYVGATAATELFLYEATAGTNGIKMFTLYSKSTIINEYRDESYNTDHLNLFLP